MDKETLLELEDKLKTLEAFIEFQLPAIQRSITDIREIVDNELAKVEPDDLPF